MKVVIVGNGIAGNQVAFRIRSQNGTDDIRILSAESVPEYDPCSLPYYLGRSIPKKMVFRKRMADYDRHHISLDLNAKAVAIDPGAKAVETEAGDHVEYDKLVLAHGGHLFVPPIEGIQKAGVFSCKQLSETEKLLTHRGCKAVVIGSGAIGIEVAEALKKIGYQVAIVEVLDRILPALFDLETAKRLEASLRECGVDVLTSEKVLAIEGDDRVERVVTDQRTLPCDTVVIATGVVPDTALVKSAGIRIKRGIEVDERMQTSETDIFACGDCVETVDACTGEDAMFQLKHNALDQASVVAANILGEDVKYAGAYAFARVHFWHTHGATFGKTTHSTQCELGELEIVERESGRDYLRLILKENVLVGGQAIGRYANVIGFFISSMRRKDNMAELRNNWRAYCHPKAYHLWPQRLFGEIAGVGGAIP